MVQLLKKFAYRDRIGDLLAERVKEASRRLGKGSEEFAIHMKGQDTLDPYRIRKGWALGWATSPVGGRHLRGSVRFPARSGGKGVDWITTEYDSMLELVFWQLRIKEMEDIAGVCIALGSLGVL